MLVFSAGLAILASILYHIIQKAIPQDVNPIVTLTVTYLTAIATALLLLPVFPIEHKLTVHLGKLNWASIALGVAVLGIEVGFLIAYRAGWQISTLSIVVNVAAALILLPIGLLLFNEKLTALNLGGIVVCIIGLIMINWK